jgi:predicted N-acetyltransferase YhbS
VAVTLSPGFVTPGKRHGATLVRMTQQLANCLPPDRPLPTPIEAGRALRDGGRRFATLVPLVNRPWSLRVGSMQLTIRPGSPQDLEALAKMHARCSARSLLDRYRTGGRGPSVTALHRQLRRPLSFVAATERGAILGFAVAAIDVNHGRDSANVGLIVEDEWQGLGIGRELVAHLAGAAAVSGYTQLVAYTATSPVPMQRVLVDVGHTRFIPDATHPHLHALLSESAALGIGAVRERMAS